ncbi:MAG: Fe(3+) ABC transporter substrate-binding protein [Acuticoccus sp.]
MRSVICGVIAAALLSTSALANGEVNLYSSRHYDTDEALYSDFEEQTGITVNRIEDGADKLIERMRAEGELSNADLLLTVDVGRVKRADAADLLQPLGSEEIAAKVPQELHGENDRWLGVTTRARIIFYNKENVSEPPQTYQDLADPKYKGKICTRSSSNVYMQALLASIVAHDGEEAAKEWAAGLLANLARDPEGGDTDQLRGLLSGVCDIALSNHYYYARGFRKEVAGLTDNIDKIGYVFPNQDTTGTHVNISGIGVAKHAPNADNARAFIDYLLTPRAQKLLADGNDEFPVVDGVKPSEAVQSMGDFKRDQISLVDVADNTTKAQEIYNEVGYK